MILIYLSQNFTWIIQNRLFLCSVNYMFILYPTSTGLYFMKGNTIYNSGDTVNINAIGNQPIDHSDPGTTLVCVTSNINHHCCRNKDNPNMGALGYIVDSNGQNLNDLRYIGSATDDLFVVRRNQQLRLGKVGSPTGPLGVYTCVVPDMSGSDVTANITLSGK